MKEMLELHRTYKRHDPSIKTENGWKKRKKNTHFGDMQIKLFLLGVLWKILTFLLGIRYFPRSRFKEEGEFVLWLPFHDLSTFQGKISQFPPSIRNTHSSQERVLPNRLLSNSWPLHGFVNWVALLSYLDDFDVAVFELRLLHSFSGDGIALQTWVRDNASERKQPSKREETFCW